MATRYQVLMDWRLQVLIDWRLQLPRRWRLQPSRLPYAAEVHARRARGGGPNGSFLFSQGVVGSVGLRPRRAHQRGCGRALPKRLGFARGVLIDEVRTGASNALVSQSARVRTSNAKA